MLDKLAGREGLCPFESHRQRDYVLGIVLGNEVYGMLAHANSNPSRSFWRIN
jgi:hypothetical protein